MDYVELQCDGMVHGTTPCCSCGAACTCRAPQTVPHVPCHQEWCSHIRDAEQQANIMSRVAGAALYLAEKNARGGPDSVMVDTLRDILNSTTIPDYAFPQPDHTSERRHTPQESQMSLLRREVGRTWMALDVMFQILNDYAGITAMERAELYREKDHAYATLASVMAERDDAISELNDTITEKDSPHCRPEAPIGDIHRRQHLLRKGSDGTREHQAIHQGGRCPRGGKGERRGATRYHTGKTGRGQPGRAGISHNVKSSCTKTYVAEECACCGETDLELLRHINKSGGTGKNQGEKNAYMATIICGWCDACKVVTNPAPHLVWGSWMGPEPRAIVIQYKSNPLGRKSIMDNLEVLHKFTTSAGAVSNVTTAQSKSLKHVVLPKSVIGFIAAKMKTAEEAASSTAAARATDGQAAEPPPPPTYKRSEAELSCAKKEPARRKTRRELAVEARRVPYDQTPQGITDKRPTRNTTSYPGSHGLSFIEQCREWCTMATHRGVDESKTVVDGWCHSIVLECTKAAMLSVVPHKNMKTINKMFGGMRGCWIHDHINIYNDPGWCVIHLHSPCN